MAEKDVLAGEKAILETVMKNAKAISDTQRMVANTQQALDLVLKNQTKILALLDKTAPKNQRVG